jgi:hypothetical protein
MSSSLARGIVLPAALADRRARPRGDRADQPADDVREGDALEPALGRERRRGPAARRLERELQREQPQRKRAAASRHAIGDVAREAHGGEHVERGRERRRADVTVQVGAERDDGERGERSRRRERPEEARARMPLRPDAERRERGEIPERVRDPIVHEVPRPEPPELASQHGAALQDE